MERTYQRSQVLYFHELTTEQQLEAINEIGEEELESETFVLWNDTALPLSMFMRIDKGLFHGAYSTSAFSAYLIRLNKTNEFATVVYAHW